MLPSTTCSSLFLLISNKIRDDFIGRAALIRCSRHRIHTTSAKGRDDAARYR